MGPDVRRTIATLTRLRQEVAEDRQAMSDRLAEMVEAKPRLAERPWTSHAALAVHAWYTALEAALGRIARELDGDVPRGERWHRDLLSQATVEVPGVRPAILPRAILPELLGLLAFRHFFRHAYAVSVDPERLALELERVQRVAHAVDAGLDGVDSHLESAIEALRADGG